MFPEAAFQRFGEQLRSFALNVRDLLSYLLPSSQRSSLNAEVFPEAPFPSFGEQKRSCTLNVIYLPHMFFTGLLSQMFTQECPRISARTLLDNSAAL